MMNIATATQHLKEISLASPEDINSNTSQLPNQPPSDINLDMNMSHRESPSQYQPEAPTPNDSTVLVFEPSVAEQSRDTQNMLQTPQSATIDSAEYTVLYEPETKIYLTKTCIMFAALILCPILGLLTIYGVASYAFLTLTAFFFIFCFALIDIIWTFQELEDLWAKSEDAFKPFEIYIILFALLILYLRLERALPTSLFSFVPLVLFAIVYLYISRASWKTKAKATFFRAYYILQIIFISCKIDQLWNWDWKYILCFAWVYLAVTTISHMSFMVSLYQKLTQSNNINTSKKLGFCWYLGYCSLSLLGVLAVYGFARAYDSTKDFKLLKVIACTSIVLNALLLIITILTRNSLIKFIIAFRLIKSYRAIFEASIKSKPKKTISLQVEKKEEFFKMISSTYFVLIDKDSFALRKKSPQSCSSTDTASTLKSNQYMSLTKLNDVENQSINLFELDENLCYICCKDTADAIMIPCGHGGVCYNCASSSIKEKDECMECRKKVEALYRVSPGAKHFGIVKAIEVSNVVVNCCCA